MSTKDEVVSQAFDDAFRSYRQSGRASKRHPLEVTSDRLAKAAEDFYDELWDIGGGALMDEIAHVRDALDQVASR